MHQPAANFDGKRDAFHRRKEAVMTRTIAQTRVLAVRLLERVPHTRWWLRRREERIRWIERLERLTRPSL